MPARDENKIPNRVRRKMYTRIAKLIDDDYLIEPDSKTADNNGVGLSDLSSKHEGYLNLGKACNVDDYHEDDEDNHDQEVCCALNNIIDIIDLMSSCNVKDMQNMF